MSTESLYLDAAATTPLGPDALRAMLPYLEGDDAQALAAAHQRVADAFGVGVQRLRLVGGGTSGNNLAIRGVARALGPGRFVSQPTEHPSVLEPLRALEREGCAIEWLPVSADGLVDPEDLRAALKSPALLVSIMFANHETGVVQDMPALEAVCRDAGALLHVDGVQGLRTGLHGLRADLLTTSAHKIEGPKGIGALVCSDRAPALTATAGVSTALAVGFAAALDARLAVDAVALSASRDALEARILQTITGVSLIGGGAPRLAGHLCVAFEGVSGEAVVVALDVAGIAASSGAACASGSGAPSPVLLALGHPESVARGSVRFSLLRPLTTPALERVALEVRSTVSRLRRLAT